MFKCFCCGKEFTHPKESRERFGEYMGESAYMDVDVCPYCRSYEIAEAVATDAYGDDIFPGDVYYTLDELVKECNLNAYLEECKVTAE